MGRQASAASRNAQKWQVAGRGNESGPLDMPSEDEHSGSTRLPSSDGASPRATSGEGLWDKFAAETQKEKDDRERWADVESDGEEVKVFDGDYRNCAVDSWTSAKGKSKGGKASQKTRGYKADPPPPRAIEAPRQAAVKQPQAATKASQPYRAPKQDIRHNAPGDRYNEPHYDQWAASSWSGSGRGSHGWSNANNGSKWDEGSWKNQKSEVKADFHKGHGSGKEKNESFKRGPQVTVNMDRSRLAW